MPVAAFRLGCTRIRTGTWPKRMSVVEKKNTSVAVPVEVGAGRCWVEPYPKFEGGSDSTKKVKQIRKKYFELTKPGAYFVLNIIFFSFIIFGKHRLNKVVNFVSRMRILRYRYRYQ